MDILETAQYKGSNTIRAFRKWIIPYAASLVYNNRLRPVLSYLFIEWKCNINCHYCFQFDNQNHLSMSFETAKSSIDWLKTLGCRALPLMGGEPLLRKDFVLRVIEYGSRQGFFVYLPTNGYLLTEDFIDEAGKAGVAAINLAVDCIEPKRGLPKALMIIEPQFRYLVEKQKKYGYILFFNINITSKNLKDVKLLTEIAHDNAIATDYHLNEPPQSMVEIGHYKHRENDLWIQPDQAEEVDQLLDWIIHKQRRGYPMVNPIAHLEAFKERARGKMKMWGCRAGKNGILIKPDGSLSPCFDLITLDHDWGTIWNPKFDNQELARIKEKCMPNCSSTCFYTMAHYYNPREVLKWVKKHGMVG
ncbi:MAG: radical SAM protein [Deltaproteobacteria bacterium]|nr:radical SAM protein [Deltaproteobacteria bacterium]MBW2305802.1 radical SAM protein [Deltaproteobacteria bacterium]